MKKITFLFFINLSLVLLQESFIPVIFGYRFYVNLYLAFVIALFFDERENKAFISAITGGLIIDLLSVGIVGQASLIVTLLLIALGFAKKVFYKSWIIRAVLAFIVFLSYSLIMNRGFTEGVLFSCLLTLVFSLIFKLLLDRILNEKSFS